ncbi:MAG: serine--tRNA ligase [Chitinophagaceae bacterium]|nr:serine--tRNA ligase [Chitinophagaceae bacterium]
MLQLSVIRQNPALVKERLAVKHFAETSIVDEIVSLDDELRKLKQETEDTQSKIKKLSEQIGALLKNKQAEEANAAKKEVEPLKNQLASSQEKLNNTEKKLNDLLIKLPNLPSEKVPRGKTPEDNEVVKEGGEKPKLHAGAAPHWELAKKYKLIDFELGNKVTGSGFPFYTGQGAKLQRALIQYFLDFNIAAGYAEYVPPFVVNQDSAFGTGQLPDKEGQMYHVTEDDLYLIPTAEVPVTNIYRNEIIKETDLPVKMTAYTPCFRREAGSYGKDVRGLNRLHQFDKVELVQLVDPAKSYDALDEMVSHVEKLVQSLGLPYRILRLCGGDMSFASALTYDFEVFSTAQEKWLEVSSVSNFESYQTNRMKIRFRNASGKSQLVHSLNGSSLALPRILASLLENNQTEQGIDIPGPVRKYFGSDVIR